VDVSTDVGVQKSFGVGASTDVGVGVDVGIGVCVGIVVGAGIVLVRVLPHWGCPLCCGQGRAYRQQASPAPSRSRSLARTGSS
jgi:hypothetical protein